jgi:hypothetical protein
MILTTKTKIESDFINLNKITNKLIQDSDFLTTVKKHVQKIYTTPMQPQLIMLLITLHYQN